MLSNIPVIDQAATTAATTYYINHDNRSESDKCIDSKGLEDIRAKVLKDEQLNDEDVARIEQCIAENRRTEEKFMKILGVVMVVILAAMLVWMFKA